MTPVFVCLFVIKHLHLWSAALKKSTAKTQPVDSNFDYSGLKSDIEIGIKSDIGKLKLIISILTESLPILWTFLGSRK